MSKISTYKLSPLYYALFLLAALFHRAYYRRFQVIGRENIPATKPVIFAANHQNALMDALAILFAARRQIVFLARADIFQKKSIASLLRFLRILPVYRIRDGYSTLGQNQDTFTEVDKALRNRIPIGIFPEGHHLGMKKLKPLRKGIARMAFQSEAAADFKLGLQIVPVGLDYSDYFRAGSDLLVIFGKPLNVADYQGKYSENPSMAFNCLRDDLAAALQKIIIDIRIEDHHDYILKAADNHASLELKKQNLRDTLWNRFKIKKKFTDEMKETPAGMESLPAGMESLLTGMESLLTGMESLPENSRFQNHKFRSLRTFMLYLLSPLFLIGFALNFLPYFISRIISRDVKDPHLSVSVRFGAGFVLFVFWYVILTAIFIIFLKDILIVLALALSLPLCSLFTFYIFHHLR